MRNLQILRNIILDSQYRYISLDMHRGNRNRKFALHFSSSWEAGAHTFAAEISLLSTETWSRPVHAMRAHKEEQKVGSAHSLLCANRGQWLSSRPRPIYSRGKNTWTCWAGSCVRPTATLNVLGKRKIPCPCRELKPGSSSPHSSNYNYGSNLTIHLTVLYGSQNKQRLPPHTEVNGWLLEPGKESVYCAARAESWNIIQDNFRFYYIF